MKPKDLFHYALIGILLFLIYLAITMLLPFATPIFLGLVLAFLLHPVYRWLKERVKKKWLASTIILVATLVVIVMPLIYVMLKLVNDTKNAYQAFLRIDFASIGFLSEFGIDWKAGIDQIALTIKDYFVNSAPNILASVADAALALFIMFVILFFALIKGPRWFRKLKEALPLNPDVKARLVEKIESVTRAVVQGQFLVSLIQGTLGGILLWIFGVPNPFFWGLVMVILSFIPLVGTPIVWGPAGIIKLFQGELINGIMILVLGGVVVMNIDNVLRPYVLSSSKARISPLISIVGVLGGLAAFGFIGLLLGPLILTLIESIIEFLEEDVKRAPAKKARRAKAAS